MLIWAEWRFSVHLTPHLLRMYFGCRNHPMCIVSVYQEKGTGLTANRMSSHSSIDYFHQLASCFASVIWSLPSVIPSFRNANPFELLHTFKYFVFFECLFAETFPISKNVFYKSTITLVSLFIIY